MEPAGKAPAGKAPADKEPVDKAAGKPAGAEAGAEAPECCRRDRWGNSRTHNRRLNISWGKTFLMKSLIVWAIEWQNRFREKHSFGFYSNISCLSGKSNVFPNITTKKSHFWHKMLQHQQKSCRDASAAGTVRLAPAMRLFERDPVFRGARQRRERAKTE